MVQMLVEELVVGETVGAPIAGLEKKLICCRCCLWMKWRRGAGEGDARLLVQEAVIGEGKNGREMVWWWRRDTGEVKPRRTKTMV